MARNSLALALVSLVLWGMAAATTCSTGPLETYREAAIHCCNGETSQAFRMFWAAAEAYSCRNDIPTIIGLLSIAVHYGSALGFLCSLILVPKEKDDRKRHHRHNHPPVRSGFSERSDNR
jgi:hypothetical protein